MSKDRRPSSQVDETEHVFADNDDINGVLWQDYLEWCAEGYVVRDKMGYAIAISTKPSLRDFEVWKQDMGYYVDTNEDSL